MPRGKYLGRLTLKNLKKKSRHSEPPEATEPDAPRGKWNCRIRSQLEAGSPAAAEWVNQSEGSTLLLPETPLSHLTEAEVVTLQKLSVLYLQTCNFGCTINIPKEVSRKRGSAKWRRGTVKDINEIDPGEVVKELPKRKTFGVPLNYLVEPLAKPPAAAGSNPGCLTPEPPARSNRMCKSASQSPDMNHLRHLRGGVPGADILPPYDPPSGLTEHSRSSENSLTDLTKVTATDIRQRSWTENKLDDSTHHLTPFSLYSQLARSATSLVDLLGLTLIGTEPSLDETRFVMPGGEDRSVPHIVKLCIQYIRDNGGLDTVGIFRVGGSKRRIKALRDECDLTSSIQWTNHSEATIHDVAALLKEFLRDLPAAITTRELYQPLLQTCKAGSDEGELKALKHVLCLLPRANRDTLAFLLSFLHDIHLQSTSTYKDAGNKMDADNLATIFGPTLIKPPSVKHTTSTGDIEVEKHEFLEDYNLILHVTKRLILHHRHLFSAESRTLSDVLQIIQQTNPEAVDAIIDQRYSSHISKKSRTLQTVQENPNSPRRIELSCRQSIKEAREKFFREITSVTSQEKQPATAAERKASTSEKEVGVYVRKSKRGRTNHS